MPNPFHDAMGKFTHSGGGVSDAMNSIAAKQAVKRGAQPEQISATLPPGHTLEVKEVIPGQHRYSIYNRPQGSSYRPEIAGQSFYSRDQAVIAGRQHAERMHAQHLEEKRIADIHEQLRKESETIQANLRREAAYNMRQKNAKRVIGWND